LVRDLGSMSIAHNRMIDSARRNSWRFNNEVPVGELPAHVLTLA
jgi:hypothetical protein